MDEHVAESSNRPVGIRLQEQAGVADLAFEGFTASVLYMDKSGGLHGPESVEGSRAAAR